MPELQVKKLVKGKMKCLNLGCEKEYREGWVNVDFDRRVRADLYFDLNNLPYPFKDDEFDEILASAILEHLNNVSGVMIELYRISKDKGMIYIFVPHCSCITCTWAELEHKQPFSWHTFGESWCNKELYHLFEVVKKKFIFTRLRWKWMNIVNPLLNLFPRLYEKQFSQIFPCSHLIFILRVRKDKEFQNNMRKKIEDEENLNKPFIDNYKWIKGMM